MAERPLKRDIDLTDIHHVEGVEDVDQRAVMRLCIARERRLSHLIVSVVSHAFGLCISGLDHCLDRLLTGAVMPLPMRLSPRCSMCLATAADGHT